MKKLIIIAVLAVIGISGCSFNLKGPEIQASIYRKTEGAESRRASPQWAGSSSGNKTDRMLRKFFNTK